MNLLDNETYLLESENNRVKLTTHRIRFYESTSKNPDFTSIMLDKISSIELTFYKSSIWFLIIGVLTIPALVGIILIILYFTSRRHVVSVTPDGGKPIIFETKGMKREFLEELINKVEISSLKLKKM